MKMTNKISKKLIVSTLSTVMGVSLVGAITGTVAWYQYSTRSTVSFVGTTIRSSENLLIGFAEDGDFENDLSHSEIADYFADHDINTELLPVTTGAIEKNAALPAKLKAQPIYQYFDYEKWLDADEGMYVQFPVYIKLDKVDNTGVTVNDGIQRKVYLSDLVIQNHSTNAKNDVSDAIRVHLDGDHEKMLFSKNGGQIDVHGKLDLNLDDRLDTEKPAYSFEPYTSEEAVDYGEGVQKAYSFEDQGVRPVLNNDGTITGEHYLGTLNSAKAVVPEAGPDQEHPNVLDDTYFTDEDLTQSAEGEVADGQTTYYVRREVIKVTVTIWLEGWEKLTKSSSTVTPAEDTDLAAGDYWTNAQCTVHATGTADGNAEYYTNPVKSAIWDPELYSGATFDVGLMFEVEA